MPTIPPDLLDRSVAAFMRRFLVHLNPILHRTVYGGRSWSEYEIIVCMALSVCGPMRPSGLSRGLAIDKGSLTAVIRRLRGFGLIERREVPGDERGYAIALTDGGRAFAAHLDAQRQQGFRALFADMDPEEIAAAARGLDLLTAYLRKKESGDAPMGAQTGPRTA